jgi:hypothetical protein
MQPESTSQRPSLECFRSYVVLLSRWYWNPCLQGKLDPSDIVQSTRFISASCVYICKRDPKRHAVSAIAPGLSQISAPGTLLTLYDDS